MFCQSCGNALVPGKNHVCPGAPVLEVNAPDIKPRFSPSWPLKLSIAIVASLTIGGFAGWTFKPVYITTPCNFKGSLDLKYGKRTWKQVEPTFQHVPVVFKGMETDDNGDYGIWIMNFAPVDLIPADTAHLPAALPAVQPPTPKDSARK